MGRSNLNRNKKQNKKRKQTDSPSPGNPAKMADNSNSDTKLKQTVNQTPEQNISTSNVLSAANNSLYGATTVQGYPFTPYMPPGPHTTPANMIPYQLQTLPSPSPTQPLYQSYPQLECFMSNVTERLKKLDILDDILARVVYMEGQFKRIDSELIDIKQQIKTNTNNIGKIDQGLVESYNKIQCLDRQVSELAHENMILRERSIDQQLRSMKENLIFKGISDSYDPDENTEAKVVEIIQTELEITDQINFHVVHRLKPKPDKSARSIIAKFERRKDRNAVLKAAIEKLKDIPHFVVHEQYPIEIIEERRKLVPFMKDAREKGHHAVLVEDKLYIDKRRFIPRGPFVPSNNSQMTRPYNNGPPSQTQTNGT